MQILTEILREIEGMAYLAEGIGCGLEDAGITDRYEAAAYGFEEAKNMSVETIRSHMEDDGWIPCSRELPGAWDVDPDLEPEDIIWPEYIVTIAGYSEATALHYDFQERTWFDDDGNIYKVAAWMPIPEAYRPEQKSIGDDCKDRIMGRFLKAE